MYEYIKGSLTDAAPTYAVVECGGIGYYVNISVNTYSQIAGAKEVVLFLVNRNTPYVIPEDCRVWVSVHLLRRESFCLGHCNTTAFGGLVCFGSNKKMSAFIKLSQVCLKLESLA